MNGLRRGKSHGSHRSRTAGVCDDTSEPGWRREEVIDRERARRRDRMHGVESEFLERVPDADCYRVAERRFPWGQLVGAFLILIVLAAGQALIMAEYAQLPSIPLPFVLGMTGYWLIVAAVTSLVTFMQIRSRYIRPMREFGEAARRVSSGDFDVYLEPRHLPGSRKWDATDAMFMDFDMMVEELSGIETMKNDFVSNVSHEIKTPLAIIQSYAKHLEKPGLNEADRLECSRTIVAATERLNTLVANTLKLSRLENQRITSTAEDYDLPRQLSDVAVAMLDLFEAKDIDFDVDIEDRALVHADPGMMEIVWSNVLGNALKYTESGGSVSLRQTSDAHSATVTVRDTGCGMSERELAHVFDKFFQGDTSHAAEGNGLGMAMVRRAVELVHGRIHIDSAPGVGTTVAVTIPAAR